MKKFKEMTEKDYDILSVLFLVLFILYFLASNATENGVEIQKDIKENLRLVSITCLLISNILLYRGIKAHDKNNQK